MLVFKKIADLQHWLDASRKNGKTTGFAPTMGALHAGHMSLVQAARAAGDIAVVSIFVNPTQFNDPKDLEKYPRMPGQDIALLLSAGCDALFMPEVDEVYTPGQDLAVHLDFRQLTQVMEGEFRPGHFAGVATVVKRLLDIVQPDRLYMGQKDFQQVSVVREMLHQLHSPVRLIMCPTTREPDGLAMSSRNLRLSPEMRTAAPAIYRTLGAAKTALPDKTIPQVRAEALEALSGAGLKPEYFDIVDGNSLLPVDQYTGSNYIVACTAAWAGDVRLIDNMVLKEV